MVQKLAENAVDASSKFWHSLFAQQRFRKRKRGGEMMAGQGDQLLDSPWPFGRPLTEDPGHPDTCSPSTDTIPAILSRFGDSQAILPALRMIYCICIPR